MKLFRKATAVVLVFASVLSFAMFGASAEDKTVAVSVECSGSGRVSNGVQSSGSTLEYTYNVGDTVTLTATADAENEFLFWKNTETERIMCTDTTYTFPAATYQKLEAVFDMQQDVLREKYNAHTVIYMTQGQNVLSMRQVTLGSTNVGEPDDQPLIPGFTFERWSYTPEEVAQSDARVFVSPVYTNNASACVITTIVGGYSQTQQVSRGKSVRVVAPETLDGATFSYWVAHPRNEALDNEIVSYRAAYDFLATVDVTLEAVYGMGTGSGIVTRIAGDVPDFENAAISIYEQHSVSDDYTVLESGLIFTRSISVGNSASAFIINPDNPDIRKGTSKEKYYYGSYGVTIKNWHATTTVEGQTVNYYPLLFARSYIVVEDAEGNSITEYGAIYVVDYINTTFVGIIEGDNYEDPFNV